MLLDLGTMLLLADAAFDGNEFLDAVHHSGARFLVRSGARRVPTPAEHLEDGSYIARIGYGVLRVLLPVRVIEATSHHPRIPRPRSQKPLPALTQRC